MAVGYTKLFSEIIMSTVWREPDHVRLLWITMLALKDRWHVVNASIPGLADSARITLDQCQQAIRVLSEPDPYSRTLENEGRRIAKCEGGFIILNGEKYRNKMSLDERREYQRIKQREYRERESSVKSCQQNSQQLTHTDTDTEADTKALTKTHSVFVLPDWIDKELWSEWMDIRKRKKSVNTKRSLDALIRNLEIIKDSGIDANTAISTAIEKSWKSVELSWLQIEGKKNGKQSKLDEAAESIRKYRPV